MTRKVVVIAEAGVNHNGDISQAERLIDVAAEAGADYVKFQTFKADKLVSKDAQKADYQQNNLVDKDTSQYAMLKKLELSEADHYRLREYAASRNIRFLSTAFDLESIDFLDTLGVDVFKIPSGEITNYPYLVKIAGKGKPVILSTGMADMEEVQAAADVLINNGISKNDVIVLHCNTEYPTPYHDVNLKAMLSIGERIGVAYGYSDHTLGIEVPIAAVAMGACMIEKHFTIDRNLPGPDHKASLEPGELKQMVSAIRNIELALAGDGQKTPSASELKNKIVGRKSIFISKHLPAGHVLTPEDLIMKRPGDGISPMMFNAVVGRTLSVDLPGDSKLSWTHLI